ncbi:hypothetical protein [Clostridium estertheticum]|uniref:hypothetical protein n=1 Tax=Clostridium estertheticum TaxID=238834 RepID=UPI001C0B7712|nr:hypothetical protein [Clostridium estertheticum]MBU3186507.1 hypothetical protein [Clostridium estertheticum]
MQVKMIEANRKNVFEDLLNEFCRSDIDVKDIKYSTSGTITTGYRFSAMVLYTKTVTYEELFSEADIINSLKENIKRNSRNMIPGGM